LLFGFVPVAAMVLAVGALAVAPSALRGAAQVSAARKSERFSSAEAPKVIRERLDENEALLSFTPGTQRSLLQTVTNRGVRRYSLPGAAELRARCMEARFALEHDSAQWPRLSLALYRMLFGHISRDVLEKPVWLIEASDELFQIPFAALAVTGGPAPKYLVERHEIRRTLGVPARVREREDTPANVFLGIGDGVYNSADPRWRPQLFRWMVPGPDGELPRLAGTGVELEACARSARLNTVLLRGANASEAEFRAALARRPAIIHLGTHVIQEADGSALVLGIDGEGRRELLTSASISHLRVPGSIVAMSGCASGADGPKPGSDVPELMRAWLTAGARVVVGTRWTVEDDTGEFFREFYRHLDRDSRPGQAAARALRAATLAMLHSGTWRARPDYWATFLAVEKE
jgi:CHAT domain-containing protein